MFTSTETLSYDSIDLSKFNGVLIGVHGAAEAGKDTVAAMLRSVLGTLYIDSFARPLREAYVALFGQALGFKIDDLYSPDFKRQVNLLTNRTHREELQLLGTEHYRDGTGNRQIWVHNLYLRNINCIDFVIIPDVRFENEADFISQHGLILEVQRPGKDPIPQSGHSSEAGLPRAYINHTIVNDGTLKQLRGKVFDAVERTLCLNKDIGIRDLHDALESPATLDLYKDQLLAYLQQ